MLSSAQPDDASNLTFIRESARLNEPDRYISALLAPRAARDDLITLAAYLGEVRRIALNVSEAALGEIRLQWWRDVLSAGAQGGLSGNPIADEMVRVIARHDLLLPLVLAPLEAASVELGGETLSDEIAWLAYLDNAEGAAMHLGARILALADRPTGLPAITASGRAYAACRLALRLPELLARGRWPVPQVLAVLGDPRHSIECDARAAVKGSGEKLCDEALKHLDEARAVLSTAPCGTTIAILPVAVVACYAKAITRPGRDALRQPAQIAPLTRILKLWWASKTGRS